MTGRETQITEVKAASQHERVLVTEVYCEANVLYYTFYTPYLQNNMTLKLL